ncbi:MAG TPA: M36 family metallopeptidase [Saprospiraceae bacterium]|nr:M36 family metallopeptidase [Saprospiraceae bacterium]
MKTIIAYLLSLLLLLAARYLHGQDTGQSVASAGIVGAPSNFALTNADPLGIAREYISAHLDEWGLTPQDVDGMTVNDMYTDKTSGITRVYFLQRHRDIPVYNAILNVSITKEGSVFFAGNRFVSDLAGKVNTTEPALSASQAVVKLAAHLGLPAEELRLKKQTAESQFVFEKGDIAKEDITVMLSYQPFDGKALLAWDILFSPVGKPDKWSTRVDAVTGNVLNEFNWTVYCFENKSRFGGGDNDCYEQRDFTPSDFNPAMTGEQYNVWPAPIESPNHGPRTMVADPSDPIASPFGWHDVNGQPGPEYTITLGNNVRAYQDRDNLGHSSYDEPDGGANLHFDFPYEPSWDPEQYVDASVVNLFYWVNYMHDFAYRFGFDEVAGNFQVNNYGKGGAGNDFMFAVAQAGANQGFADNPQYSHGNEGSTGTIFMMESKRVPKYLTVNEPAVVSGMYKTSGLDAGWGAGAYVTDIPVSGEVVLVNDGIEDASTSDACEEIINVSELAGKIALIDRGTCEYGLKALQAQNAGAIGVIICNYNDEYLGLLHPGEYGADVHIPVVLIYAKSNQIIRPYIGNGLKVALVNPGQDGPVAYDYSFDNGFIAHEYGHGISWRLAGGPNAACFDNHEQMDEGWSDYFALVTTVQPGDTGAKGRGIGSYELDQPISSAGVRRYPYSTDMNINPLTYADISNSQTRHDLGEVWASVLWDLYWALVDKYGWSADLYNESSGNYKAIRLAFDGLKNLPCSPGFVDGRNAILAADSSLYGAENTCLLWEVFARRGLGYSAKQGSPFNAGDQKAAFDVLPVCANKILIEKSVTDFIQPGDDIEVTIKVGNFKPETATDIVVTDEIPAGTSFKPNSSSLPANIQGNTVSFNLGNMSFKQETTITYTLESAPGAWSQRKFLDDVPDENDANWLTYTIGNDASNDWIVTNEYPAHSGNFAWNSKETPEVTLQAMEINPDAFTFHVDGARPALRFYHRYQTEEILNAGIVEVKEVGTTAWKQVDNDMLRNGYPCFIHLQTFGLPNLKGFSGNSGNDYKASYIDLNKWAGKDIRIRFRFGTNALTESGNGAGWLIDDIEFMDLLAYNGEVCVTSAQGDLECATAPEEGTIVDSRAEPLDASEHSIKFPVKIYPNPAGDVINISLPRGYKQDVSVDFLALDGRLLFTKSLNNSGDGDLSINTGDVPAGLYLVKVSSAEGRYVGKVAIQK